MIIDGLRLAGIRCFVDTNWIALSPRCNLFVGANNAGKSTLIKGVLAWQGMPFIESVVSGDLRPGANDITYEMRVHDVPLGVKTSHGHLNDRTSPQDLVRHMQGSRPSRPGATERSVPDGRGYFVSERPDNQLVPFVARRKALQFNHGVDRRSVGQINGTLQNLYGRVDHLVSGHPENEAFQTAVREILGVQIATQATDNGKEAGFYFDRNNFVALDRMGDGVSEMVGLIAEMCLEEHKVFVLEEPETNIHPRGLKALLALVRAASNRNQFIVATHSNVVVRELAADDATKLFRVSRTSEDARAPSEVEEVPRSPAAHRDLLAELGYEFGDFDLHDGWLFLEEASAETVINTVLIPLFTPELRGRIRTFSTRGLANVERSVSDFTRLISFVHLQPVYRDRLWIRVDNDGQAVIEDLRKQFSYLDETSAAAFGQKDFERYYPAQFQAAADEALALTDKRARQTSKAALLEAVLTWTASGGQDAKAEWAASAQEPLEVLAAIRRKLDANASGDQLGSITTEKVPA